MNTRKTDSIWIVAVLAIPAYAGAQDNHRCAQQFDDAQRLACYDAQYGKPAIVRVPSAASAPPATLTPQPAAAPVAAIPAVAEPRAAVKTAAARPADNFTASIRTLDVLHDGRFKATLDSGQVWTQLEPDKAVVLAVGDTVTVRKAMLGSFQLVTPAGIRTRVKQVE